MDADETIIGVACGDAQTITVGTTGNVWGWGCYIDKEGKKFFNPIPSQSGEDLNLSYSILLFVLSRFVAFCLVWSCLDLS